MTKARTGAIAFLIALSLLGGWFPFIPEPTQVVTGQTPIPLVGDWVVTDDTYIFGVTATVNGSIWLNGPNAHLVIARSTIYINSTASTKNHIFVNSGSLEIVESTIAPWNSAYVYNIRVWSTMNITSSTLESPGGVDMGDAYGVAIYSDNVRIENTTIRNGKGTAVEVAAMVTTFIANNTFMNCENAISLIDSPTFIHPVSVIVDNHFEECVRDVIFVGQNNYPYIAGNNFVRNHWKGIQFQNTGGTAYKNNFTDFDGEAPIFLLNSFAVIEKNRVENSAYGITISGTNGTPALIANNTMSALGHDAIIVKFFANPKLSGNRFSSNTMSDIFITKTSSAIISNNTFAYNRKAGVYLDTESKATIVDNIFNDQTIGVKSITSAVYIADNDFTEIVGSGVYVSGSYGATGITSSIEANTFDEADVGIYLINTDIPVHDNVFTTSGTSGMDIDTEVSSIIEHNTFQASKVHGLRILTNNTGPTITDNLFENNLFGLGFEDFNKGLSNNTFVDNDFALHMTRSSPYLENINISGSRMDDFVLEQSSAPHIRSSQFDFHKVGADPTSYIYIDRAISFTVRDTRGRTIPGALVTVDTSKGIRVGNFTTNSTGEVAPFIISEGRVGQMGWEPYTPLRFNASVKLGQVYNVTSVILTNTTTDIDLWLDYWPQVTIPDVFYVTENTPALMELSPYITDYDNNISDISIATDSPYATVTMDNLTIEMLYTTNDLSNDVVTIYVSDGIKNITAFAHVQITTVDDKPTFSGTIPDADVIEGETWVIQLLYQYFDDEENPQDLVYSTNTPELVIDNATQRVEWTPGEGSRNLTDIVIYAHDPSYNYNDPVASNPFNLNYIPVNNPPIYLGNLEDTEVSEDTIWTLDLSTLFTDPEDPGNLTFKCNLRDINIDNETHMASWMPKDGYSDLSPVIFTAVDGHNGSLTASSDPITLFVHAVNDPPLYVDGTVYDTSVKEGSTLPFRFEDIFWDEEGDTLKYNIWVGEVQGTSYGLGLRYDDRTHMTWLTWNITPSQEAQRTNIITNVVISDIRLTARDDDGQDRVAFASGFNLTIRLDALPTNGGGTEVVYEKIPLWVYALTPVAIIATALAIYTYRKVRYSKYEIADVFLVFNDGRLITHLVTESGHGAVDEDILASMLTAIQDFVKESLSSRKEIGSLDEMKYGNLNIVIERGIFVYLAIVLKGYVTEKVREKMSHALRNIERKHAIKLERWDGDSMIVVQIAEELETAMGTKKKMKST